MPKCPRILIKRDDLTSLGLGGNKAASSSSLIARCARASGATTLITTGAVQSNHARMTAPRGVRRGVLECGGVWC
jgi:1-aminocyclopropane-1-carboxylate deaminase/D-cysteine desulfhydrase-like pyridoxal-dependent ACC family enzyme